MGSLNCMRLTVLGLALCLGWHSAPSGASHNEVAVRTVVDTLGALRSYDRSGRPSSQRVSFEFPESVVNAYLDYTLKANPRPALTALKVRFPSSNLIAAEATIDFDRLQAPETAMLPEALRSQLKGSKLVRAEFRIRVNAGRLTFEVQPPSSGEGGLPPPLLKELTRMVAAMQPEHVDTTSPVPLPFGLRRLSVGPQGLAGDTQ